MKRILLIIQFMGTNYSGWQVQPGQKTIQSQLQEAIKLALNEDVETISSSRTDAGVHSYAMPVHFDTNTKMKPENIFKAINAYLPNDIKVLSSQEVKADFHARFDVKEKTYEYCFYENFSILPMLDLTSARISAPFDFNEAKLACKYFLGTHNFKAFCSAGGGARTTIRTIKYIDLLKTEFGYKLVVTGDGFLYNMVRIIAGTIIEVGQGKIKGNDIPDIINSLDRNRAGKTAEAKGLALKKVEY